MMYENFLLNTGLSIGSQYPTRVNCNIGANTVSAYKDEIKKIKRIASLPEHPDLMMDLSLKKFANPLYKILKNELNISVGTVLSYIPFSKREGLNWNKCKEYLIELGESGISFVTIHFTAELSLYKQAIQNKRLTPMSSRGGGLCLFDQKINSRHKNIFFEHIDEIVNIAKKFDIAISIGSAFRPANIFDALDEVHIKETKMQKKIKDYLNSKNVKVIIENIGHISLANIERHKKLLQSFHAPIMPLGPIPTDSAVNYDHIAASIGAAFASYWNCAHIINSISRYEHSESKITTKATIEAIKTAQLVAHIINVSKGFNQPVQIDYENAELRSISRNCLATQKKCNRCINCCPLKIMEDTICTG